MNFNFDEQIDRRNTNSIKYDFALERGKPEDVLPLWVADMDFQAPKAALDAMAVSVSHGIFGYTDTKDEYFYAIKNWFEKHFSYQIEKDWLVKAPGIVFALAIAIRALTKEGDAVMIQRPVYNPFTSMIETNNRNLINNPLIYEDGEYRIDFEDFERKIIENQVKMFILCSPHNPIGRVWSLEELTKLGEICLRHSVIIISDEIHADFVHPGFKHYVFASIKPEFADISVVCTAPSKTFNLAGLQASNIFIANPKLRKAFVDEIKKTGYSQLNTMGLVACQAAYEGGEEWLKALNEYIQKNLNDVREFLKIRLPQVKLVEPQGSYLVWLDFRKLNLSQKELEERIVQKGRLWLVGGEVFGEEGIGFQRMNIACQNTTLHEALRRLESAINEV